MTPSALSQWLHPFALKSCVALLHNCYQMFSLHDMLAQRRDGRRKVSLIEECTHRVRASTVVVALCFQKKGPAELCDPCLGMSKGLLHVKD